MGLRKWTTLGGTAIGIWGAAMAAKTFLPQRWQTHAWSEERYNFSPPEKSALPVIDITFLRCGSVSIPEWIAVRGAFSIAPRVISHNAVLIRHPRGTFLYDTGLCSDIHTYMDKQPLFFRQTTGRFVLEESLGSHLRRQRMLPRDLDFALLSHLHWDHVSGIPDIPGVPLRINRVEYEAADAQGLLRQHAGLITRFLGNNPREFFDCDGPAYAGFRASHDLFGDGSLLLVPLPGHTAGHTGLFVNRANGSPLFLVGDAAWVAPNYLQPATMHPFIWSLVTSDDATARQTLLDLYHFAQHHPEIPLIAAHDASMQEAFGLVERERIAAK